MDVFTAWTGLYPEKLTGSKMNTPSNAIYMTRGECELFKTSEFYFEAVS